MILHPVDRTSAAPGKSPAAWGLHLALFLTGFGAFLNLNATQPLLPLFRGVFHASELAVSLTVSAAALAVALAAPVAGLIADRLGRKQVVVGAMLGIALATVLAATARTLAELIGWRFLQGVFIPGVAAVVMAYVSEESAPAAVGRTMATYVTGSVVGGFAGRFLNGVVAAHWSWRAGFVLLGAATFFSAGITAWRLPASTSFVRQSAPGGSLGVLGRHLHNRRLLALYAVGMTVLLSLVAIFTYINFYLADPPFHLGPSGLASLFTVYLIGAAITPISGKLIDRWGGRRALLGAVAFAAVGVLLTLVPRLPVVVIGLTLLSSGVFACQAAASSGVGQAAGQARSSAAGLYVSVYYLGGTLGSVVPGLFWSATGWPGCVVFVLAVQLLTACIAYAWWDR